MKIAAIFVPKVSIFLGTDVIIIADLLIFLKHCLHAKHMFNLIVRLIQLVFGEFTLAAVDLDYLKLVQIR